MKMNFKQLEAFVWVATMGSFRRTAERLHTTQPNISVRISRLEDILGVKLFERDAGSVTLTPEGQKLLDYAKNILAATDELARQAESTIEVPGVIRLGITEMVVETWLGTFLDVVKSHHPNLVIELTVDLTVNLRTKLVERSLDIAFLNGPISDFNISNTDLGLSPFAWISSPSIDSPMNTIDDLARHPILTHGRNTRPYTEVANYFRENCDQPVRLVPSTHLSACLQMTISGFGISVLPRPLIQQPINEGSVVEIPFDWTPTPLTLTASYPYTPTNLMINKIAELAQSLALVNL